MTGRDSNEQWTQQSLFTCLVNKFWLIVSTCCACNLCICASISLSRYLNSYRTLLGCLFILDHPDPVARPSHPAQVIFHSPVIFKWQALIVTLRSVGWSVCWFHGLGCQKLVAMETGVIVICCLLCYVVVSYTSDSEDDDNKEEEVWLISSLPPSLYCLSFLCRTLPPWPRPFPRPFGSVCISAEQKKYRHHQWIEESSTGEKSVGS